MNIIDRRRSACFAKLTYDAFEVVVVSEVNHDLTGVVLFQLDVDLCPECVTQGVLQTQHVVRQAWFIGR